MIGSSNLYPVVGVEETGSSRPGEDLESSEAIGHRISRVSQSGMEDFSPSLSVVSNRMEGSNNDMSSLKAEKSFTSELVQSPRRRIDASEETGEWKSNKYFYDNSPLIRGNNHISAPQSEKSRTSELVQSSNHRIDTNEEFREFRKDACVSNRMEGSNKDMSSLKAEKSFTSELVQSPHRRIDASEETGEWKSNKYFYDNSPLIRGNNDISAPQSEKSSTSELVQSSNHRIDTNEEFHEFRKDACVSNRMEGSNNDMSSLKAEIFFTSELVQSPHHRIDTSEEIGEWKSNKYFYDNSPLIRGNYDISAPQNEKSSTSELVQSSNHRIDTNAEFCEFRKDACVSNRMEGSNNDMSSLKAEKSFTSELVQSPRRRIDASEETGEWKSNKYFYDNSPLIRGNNYISAPQSEKSRTSELVQSSNHRIDTNEEFREFRKDACVSNRMEGSNNDMTSLKAEKSFTSELVQSPQHRIDASEETGEWKTNKYFYDNSPLIRGNNDISAPQSEKSSTSELVQSSNHRIDTNEDTVEQKSGKYFYYDSPLYEDTGFWIPVSVPPMLESDRDEWSCGFGSNGGYFPEEEFNWDQFLGEDKEMTMWDVVSEMLLVARGKVSALSSGNIISHRMSWISTDILEETWKEMANTLAEANFGNSIEILETEPPKWLSDSAAAACMLCNIRFHPIMCSRHHCRFCGGIFCNDCSKGRSLLPRKFRDANPRRVCDVCCVRLESVQPYLMNQISHASQIPTHDTTDLSTLRSWLNFPWGRTMEYEIYKAANIVRSYCKVGSLKPEKSIPDIILKQAKGLAILTVVNVGMMVTYKVGTGLVLARREDGSWSPPSAISSFGIGWGAQAGGELTDYIIVLRNEAAIKTFSGNGHLSIGAGLSAAAGIFGRAAEADVRAGDGGIAACYTYSCSKGAFVGCALNGNMVTTRVSENSRFYGAPLKAPRILLGSLPRPPAAAILYRALSELFIKLESYPN